MNNKTVMALDVSSLIQKAIQAHQSGQLQEAEKLYHQVLENLANLEGKIGSIAEQEEEQLRDIRQGERAKIYNNLGNLLREQGQLENAIQCYREALRLDPSLVETYYNLGLSLNEQEKLEEAVECYHQLLSLETDSAETYYQLGNIHKTQGEQEKALELYEQALKIEPSFSKAKFALCLSQIPIIYNNYDQIKISRANYRNCLQTLEQDCQRSEPQEQQKMAEAVGSVQPFFLAYQGLNDRDLQATYGKLMCQLMASRYPQWSQARLLVPLKAQEKIRVGFVCRFFHTHSVWKIPLKGWVQNLDKTKFELFGYYTYTKWDRETEIASRAFDKFIQGKLSIEKWCEVISGDQLHVLIFSEIGMDPISAQLACLKLAPIQMTSWGHPDTSGLPTIDYYLSSDLMEPNNAQSHYTEKLLKLPNLSIYYTPFLIQPKQISRREMGVEDDDIMFWCCQSLYKYLPQHDDIFAKIAQGLEHSKFVFIGYRRGKLVTERFRKRLKLAFADCGLDYLDYCIFLPRLDRQTFAGTAAMADVTLDTIDWSGCNSILESIIHNVPVVTLPGDLMRGRHTAAILKMIGIEETIASSKEHYVELAVRLGRDCQYRQDISRQIAENKYKLYEDLEPVIALENFLCHAVQRKTLQLALQLHRANQLTEAEQVYRQILTTEPEQIDSLYGLGVLSNQSGDTIQAEQLFRKVLQVQPDYTKAWLSLGNLYQGQGQLSEAVEAYQKASALQPNLVAIHNNLGYVLQQQGNLDEAIACYQRALELQPNCVEAEINLANVFHSQGKLSPEQRPHYAALNLKLGNSQQQQGNLTTAIECYRQAIALQPDLAEAHYQLGIALQEQGQEKQDVSLWKNEIIACYQRTIELNPNWGEAYLHLGKIEQQQDNLSTAASAYRQGLTILNPYYARAVATGETIPEEDTTSSQLPQQEIVLGRQSFPAIPPVSGDPARRPFWSVVIPVYNRTQYLLECLATVLAQWPGEGEMEILVIDDASTPPLAELVDSIGRGIVRYHRNPQNLGLPGSWNAGIALSRGQWIHLLHDDDYVLPGFYGQLKLSLENCPDSVGAAFTGYENIDETGNVIFRQQLYGEQAGIAENFLQRIGIANPLNMSAVVIRRATHEQLGGYHPDLVYTPDWELYKRIAAVYDWWYEPAILARYRQHSQNMTAQLFASGSQMKCIRRAIEISEAYLPPDCRSEITAKSRRHFFGRCLKNATHLLKSGKISEAFHLLLEAITLDRSNQALEELFVWLNQDDTVDLREQIITTLLQPVP